MILHLTKDEYQCSLCRIIAKVMGPSDRDVLFCAYCGEGPVESNEDFDSLIGEAS